MLQLSMKCSNSAFNARASRLAIVIVQLGAVKIYVASSKQWRRSGKRKDRMKFSLPPKSMVFWVSSPPLSANVLFLQVLFLNLTLCMTKLRVLVLCFSYFTDNSNVKQVCVFWQEIWGANNTQYHSVYMGSFNTSLSNS